MSEKRKSMTRGVDALVLITVVLLVAAIVIGLRSLMQYERRAPFDALHRLGSEMEAYKDLTGEWPKDLSVITNTELLVYHRTPIEYNTNELTLTIEADFHDYSPSAALHYITRGQFGESEAFSDPRLMLQ